MVLSRSASSRAVLSCSVTSTRTARDRIRLPLLSRSEVAERRTSTMEPSLATIWYGTSSTDPGGEEARQDLLASVRWDSSVRKSVTWRPSTSSAGVAEPLQPAVADAQQPALAVDGVQHDRRVQVERAVLLLALPQRLRRPPALGDVADDEQQAAVVAREVAHLVVEDARRRDRGDLRRHRLAGGARQRGGLAQPAGGVFGQRRPEGLADPVAREGARDAVPGRARAGDAPHDVRGVDVHVGVRQGGDELPEVGGGALELISGGHAVPSCPVCRAV